MTDNIARILALIAQGGGGSQGTMDYEDLDNKPSLGGVTIVGDMDFGDLHLNAIWVGTSAQYEIDKNTIEDGTLVFITDSNDVDSTPTQNSTKLVTSGGVYAFVMQGLNNKVDKETGKGLSTEDYTTVEKTKLAELTNDYTNLTDKPQINGTTLTGDKSSTDLGLLPASTRYGASINTRDYFDPVTGDMLTDINLKDQNGSDMSTITFNQPVVDVGCDSSGLLVTYPSARASIDLSPAMSRKVDKVQGKGLSTNDFTYAAKIKLDNIEDQANKTVVDSALSGSSTNPVRNSVITSALGNKVDKIQGKGLSSEDFTAMYRAWLDVSMQSPLNHNGIFRGKDLTNVYTIDQMYSMIHSGNFDDLFLGDYINVSITTTLPDETVKTETVSLMIAAFDYYYNIGDTALTTHHVIFVPRGAGFSTTSKMNDTNTTAGSYLHSYMHETVLPCYAASLKVALNNHVLSHRTLLPNAINSSTPSMAGAGFTGASSGWEWTTVELQLMTEQQVYGTRAWTSSVYDIGVDYRKLLVFDFISPVHIGRNSFWLRSVVSSTYFAFCSSGGNASSSGASYASYVRPLILFG